MNVDRYIGESEMYQHKIVETMKTYGLIYDEEVEIVENYLFDTNSLARAK